MYHTQERRNIRILSPMKCVNDGAWLGEAWYFWYYYQDAIFWGITAKRRTGYYEIYSADINCENVLDTVFNEDHYSMWVKNVDRAISMFYKKNPGKDVKIKDINDFFRSKGVLEGIEGIMFQDITSNPEYWVIRNFQFKKRIQIAVYNQAIMTNFAFNSEEKCV